jgi:hypothetical protein
MDRACSMHRMKKNVYMIFVGKPEGKRPQGRPRCWRENDIKMDLREVGWGGMDWIHLTQDRDRWCVSDWRLR